MDEKAYETERLNRIIGMIDRILCLDEQKRKELKEEIIEERERIWDDLSRGGYNPETDLQDTTVDSQADYLRSARVDFLEQRKSRLVMLRDNPYFARIDFKENGEDEAEQFYIGMSSLSDPKTAELYVCDWRADISSLFYEHGLGPVIYKSPVDDIPGEITLRRQFRISDSKLKYMFDSDIAIEDNVLQDELGKNSDAKLKNIVSTIQAEQNRIIRDLSCDILLVQGVAGSGKTSIALHRLAYLMYKFRKTLTSQSIVIFSPNDVFNGYIADVLPSLGEEKVIQRSFYEMFSSFHPEYAFENPSDYYERLLSDGIRPGEEIKSSDKLIPILRAAFEKNNTNVKITEGITLRRTEIISAEELDRLFNENYRNYPPATRIQKIKSVIADDLEDNKKTTMLSEFVRKLKSDHALDFTEEEESILKENEWNNILNEISHKVDSALSPDIAAIYREALESVDPELAKLTGTKTDHEGKLLFDYPDIFPLTYLAVLAGTVRPMRKIAHAVIDEAQDYPPILFRIINSLMPTAKLTILGDISQRTTPVNLTIENISDYFNRTTTYYKLTKSYRSTSEINDYLKSVMDCSDENVNSLDRHGEAVETIPYNINKIEEALNALHEKGFKSNAIICKDRATCKKLRSKMKAENKPKIIRGEDMIKPGTDVIIPAYLTKGLEFDGVIVADNGVLRQKAPGTFYVACSRALHKLYVTE